MKTSVLKSSIVARLLALAFLLPVASTLATRAAGADATANYNLGKNKLALDGYDPVSYFAQGKAAKGKPEISAQHRGVTYWFASDAGRKLFTESPEKYLPAYGGWCATAMAKGEKVEIDPANFKVTNGRLFLFFKAFYANALKEWNKDEPNLTAKADANWKKISGE
jgi:YHS domain-containing protein